MKVDIAILTPIKVEFDAMTQCLSGSKSFENYIIGTIKSAQKNFKIGVYQSGSGNVTIALATERIIQTLNPDYIFLVGTAGGIKKVKLGDIVIGTRGYGYEAGREYDDSFAAAPKVYHCSLKMINHAKNVAKDYSKNTTHRIIAGPIAGGEKVVESTKNNAFQTIKTFYSDTVALEMEAYGFLETLSKYPNIQSLMIRSISDMLSDKQALNKKGSRKMASENAALFTKKIIESLEDNQTILIKRSYAKWIFIILILTTLGTTVFFLNDWFPKKELITQNLDKVDSTATIPKIDTVQKEVVTSAEAVKIPIEKPIVYSPNKTKKTTFSIDGFSITDDLVTTLADSTKWTFKAYQADYRIVITYSDVLEKALIPELFQYKGGHVIIKINDNICTELKQFKIADTDKYGNQKKNIEERIQQQFNKYLNQNQPFFIKKIAQCLKDFQ